jgi:phenylpyruvate tautomerase PptA (4-oxalocrotonate tautomerase family)
MRPHSPLLALPNAISTTEVATASSNPVKILSAPTVLIYTRPVIIMKSRKGLSIGQKRRILKGIYQDAGQHQGCQKERMTILIKDLALEDIGKAGRLRCDE